MSKQYATTGHEKSSLLWNADQRRDYIHDFGPEDLQPIPPDDTGSWDLVSSATCNNYILWFWQKE
jgi:hypothetical protein